MKLCWQEAEHLTTRALDERLVAVAKRVADVTIADLVAQNPLHSHGIYFFRRPECWMYIGKASSRALIERIPAHFDTRPHGWFGTLLKKMAGQSAVGPLERALELRLAILTVPTGAINLAALETALRNALVPRLNTPKRRTVVDTGVRVVDLVPK